MPDPLELPEGGFDPENPQSSLVDVAMLAIPPLARSIQTFETDPVLEAFDGGEIEAAAANEGFPGNSLSAISTGQPFDELAETFAGLGFEPEDGNDSILFDPGRDDDRRHADRRRG